MFDRKTFDRKTFDRKTFDLANVFKMRFLFFRKTCRGNSTASVYSRV